MNCSEIMFFCYDRHMLFHIYFDLLEGLVIKESHDEGSGKTN